MIIDTKMSEETGQEEAQDSMVDTEPDEGKTGDNNESESLEGIIESDQAVETNAKVAEDQELLKVLPENEEEKEKDEIVTAADAAKKPLSKTTTTGRRKKQIQQQQQQKETSITNVSKQLEKQTTEIVKIKSILQPIQKQLKPLGRQPELIKQLQSQIKEIQKQISQIQKYVAKKKR